jgi:phosphate transport system permease protein
VRNSSWIGFAYVRVRIGFLVRSRAIGETAPLITSGALTCVPFLADSIWSPSPVLPIQSFNRVSRTRAEFRQNAAVAIVVPPAPMLTRNAVAIWLRHR